VRLGFAESIGRSESTAFIRGVVLGRVLRQFQAHEPSDLGVSEPCRESHRFHDSMRFRTNVLLGRPLDSSPAYR
jgi:hypothetical protein